MDKVKRLYWNSRGEVACDAHAPSPLSDAWRDESWNAVPASERRTVRCSTCRKRGA